jgi:hypothetical protein
VRSVAIFITSLMAKEISLPNFPVYLIISSVISYIVVGLISLKFIKVNSKTTRT